MIIKYFVIVLILPAIEPVLAGPISIIRIVRNKEIRLRRYVGWMEEECDRFCH